MLSSFIITFRETLEAALIIGIVLSYLVKIKETKYNKVVYVGIAAGILTSILGALGFHWLAGGFAGRSEQIFEGITMLVGAGLLTWMILWMLQQERMAEKLKEKVHLHISKAVRYELFVLIFIAILREGIETVIYLNAAVFAAETETLTGALLGIIAATILGYIMFVMVIKVNLKHFFNITSIVLVLFAAGLVAHSIHELQEATIIPTIKEHIWDINHIIDEEGTLGSFLKGLFGYNGNPSFLEVIAWLTYIAAMCFGWWLLVFDYREFRQ